MKIISQGEKYHYCSKPGILKRWIKKLKENAVIQCDCGKYYKFTDHYWMFLSWHDKEELGLNNG